MFRNGEDFVSHLRISLSGFGYAGNSNANVRKDSLTRAGGKIELNESANIQPIHITNLTSRLGHQGKTHDGIFPPWNRHPLDVGGP